MFRALLPAPLRAEIAWDTVSHEAGSFIDPELADSHSDLLFSVRLRGAQAFVYMLLEHQSTNDPFMLLRMLAYLVRIWARYRKQHEGPLPVIIPIVIAHAPGGWTAPTSFHALLCPDPRSIPGVADLIPSFSLIVDDLSHLSNTDIKNRALELFPALALWALRDSRDSVRYEKFHAKIREHIPEAEEEAMTIAEQLRQEGMEKGRLEGRLEGRLKGRLEGRLEALITLRFGELAAEHTLRIEAATEEQLTRYLDQLATAKTLEAVFAEPS